MYFFLLNFFFIRKYTRWESAILLHLGIFIFEKIQDSLIKKSIYLSPSIIFLKYLKNKL